jgi:hypothetical protein
MTVLMVMLSSCLVAPQADPEIDLEDLFENPSGDSKPWVYWYWMRANATKEGITRDLEAMAETGIGGAYLMPIGNSAALASSEDLTLADPPADPLSDHWWDLVVHAVSEAGRLGLRLAMNACDGWALAGGPWITPEMSMQEIVTIEQHIAGGIDFEGTLARPTTRYNYYRDIAVLAYPALEGTDTLVRGADDPIQFPEQGWIQYEFDEPFTCRSIRMSPDQRYYQLHRVKLSVSDDGKKFRSLGRLKPTQFQGWQDRGMECTHAVEEVRARFFRFEFDTTGTPDMSENTEGTKLRNRNRLGASHIELSSRPAINHWEGKAGYRWRRSEWTTEKECPTDLCVDADSIIDISQHMDAEGVLKWTVPPGNWTIQRIGYTTTGETNNPAGTGSGLECDKFNPDAARIQFEGWFGKALYRVDPALAGSTLWRNHTDSWEAFSQNWSPVFRDEFMKRRGYDPVPLLPAMSGVPVGSAELSERFLYDIRRTIADLVCENFYRPFVKAGSDWGAVFSAECIAPTMMSDALQHFKYVDMPMGEFWLNSMNQDKPNDIQDAISGGHIYGKKVIGAEAFTQNPITWRVDPYYLKPMGDYNFARGINQFVFHVWAHQAFDGEPGVTLNRVGTFFGGSQTWHKPGRAWFEYVHRCSEMLQQGIPVIDVCYFIGEEQPARSFLRKDLPVPLPDGYVYDCINRDALLMGAKAENERMVLPGGMSYRLLVLPPSARMTPELAEKIGELAEAGVPVIGNLPERSISLTDYPRCDEEVRNVVSKFWSSVRQGTGTQTILNELGLLPDVEFIGEGLTPLYRTRMEYSSPPLVWNHRKTRGADIYFISNQERKSRTIDVAFRIRDRVPELWDAATGTISDAGIWRLEGDRTVVTMDLAPAGSIFVVFRRAIDTDPVAFITPLFQKSEQNLQPVRFRGGSLWAAENGRWRLKYQSGKTEELFMDDLPAPRNLRAKWTVTFTPGRGAPDQIELPVLQSLSEHAKEGIKYFSGTAIYHNTFELAGVNRDDKLFLDLGRVAQLAEVELNGNKLGILWKPPFIIEVTDVVREGRNELNIAVTNTWHNRMVGDAGLPEDQRVTWLLFKDAGTGAGADPDPAGLIGPVVLRTARKAYRP